MGSLLETPAMQGLDEFTGAVVKMLIAVITNFMEVSLSSQTAPRRSYCARHGYVTHHWTVQFNTDTIIDIGRLDTLYSWPLDNLFRLNQFAFLLLSVEFYSGLTWWRVIISVN